MASGYPSDYEDIFQLILNLVEEVKREGNSDRRITADELESYFHRLTMGSLGEYEFMRRMAFSGHPVMRIAALPVLWREYSQPVSPDFIVGIGQEKVCVEVKNYKWDNNTSGVVIPKRSADNCLQFKNFFNYDRACLAVKRFERWYLLDLEKVEKAACYDNSYLISYEQMSHADMLNESGVIFQLWTPTKYQKAASRYAPIPDGFTNEGILYSDIRLESQDYIRLRFCSGSGDSLPRDEDCLVRQYKSTQMEIINIVYQTIESNLKEVYSCGYDWQAAFDMNIEDVIPSVFSIHDRLRSEVSADELQGDIDTLASSGIMFNAGRKDCLFYLYRIATRLYTELSEHLQKDGLTFKDIMAYMKAVHSFKKVF
jgi:Holliday junction resolvase